MDVHNFTPTKLCTYTNMHQKHIVFLTVFRQNAILTVLSVKVM